MPEAKPPKPFKDWLNNLAAEHPPAARKKRPKPAAVGQGWAKIVPPERYIPVPPAPVPPQVPAPAQPQVEGDRNVNQWGFDLVPHVEIIPPDPPRYDWVNYGAFEARMEVPNPAPPPAAPLDGIADEAAAIDLQQLAAIDLQQFAAIDLQQFAVDARGAKKPVKKEEDMPKLEGIALDLDHLIDSTANRIASIGIEVEGAWETVPSMGWQAVHHDASVFKGRPALPIKVQGAGEIASPPLIPAAKLVWLRKNYPQYVDDTCGLHIHMKFKKAQYYSVLMDSPDYQATILAYLTKWAKEAGLPSDHHIWDRLAGKNKYCKPNYWPDLQVVQKVKPRNVEAVAGTKGHRYTICNFCWGLGNQTMEIRVLPMLDTPELADKALDVIIKITNAYLRATLPKTQKDRVAYRKKVTAECKIIFEEDDAINSHVRVYA